MPTAFVEEEFTMKAACNFMIGMVLAVLGGFIFLQNVDVRGFHSGFFGFSSSGMFHMGTSSMGMLVVLMGIFFFLMLVKPNFITKGLMFLSFLCFVVSIILSLDFGFKRMNAFTLFAILALFISGLALIFKAVMGLEQAEKEVEKQKQDDPLDKYR